MYIFSMDVFGWHLFYVLKEIGYFLFSLASVLEKNQGYY